MRAVLNRRPAFPSSTRRSAPAAGPTVDRLEARTLMSVVLPGGTAATPGTTSAAQPALAGTVVRDASIPFTVSAAGHTVFRGTLRDRVIKETAAGTLDFSQTIRADAGFHAGALLRYVTRAPFGGVTTDVDYRTDGPGAPPVRPVSACAAPPAGPSASTSPTPGSSRGRSRCSTS